MLLGSLYKHVQEEHKVSQNQKTNIQTQRVQVAIDQDMMLIIVLTWSVILNGGETDHEEKRNRF
jgi:hypothetical protein